MFTSLKTFTTMDNEGFYSLLSYAAKFLAAKSQLTSAQNASK